MKPDKKTKELLAIIQTPQTLKDLESITKNAYKEAITNQTQYITGRFVFGYRALQAKSILPHGSFTPWLEKLMGDKRSLRSARRFMKSAEALIHAMFIEKENNLIRNYTKSYFSIKELAISSLLEKLNDLDFMTSLVNYIAGNIEQSTLSELLRVSNTSAYKEEKEEEEQKKLKANSKELEKQRNFIETQTTFYDTLFEELKGSLETKRVNDLRFLDLSAEQLYDISDYLQRQSKEFLELAKSKKQ